MHEVRWCMQLGVAEWVCGGGRGKVSEGGKVVMQPGRAGWEHGHEWGKVSA